MPLAQTARVFPAQHPHRIFEDQPTHLIPDFDLCGVFSPQGGDQRQAKSNKHIAVQQDVRVLNEHIAA